MVRFRVCAQLRSKHFLLGTGSRGISPAQHIKTEEQKARPPLESPFVPACDGASQAPGSESLDSVTGRRGKGGPGIGGIARPISVWHSCFGPCRASRGPRIRQQLSELLYQATTSFFYCTHESRGSRPVQVDEFPRGNQAPRRGVGAAVFIRA